ncbi:MAG: Protein-L-isoaspartate O-methyltransferase [Candidatus Amesbacteria bacterium GW2011_GWA1_47_20]|uniref:Protein-L-isoaspartate O-methyltransferase n=1 Tax=Candidatus Amesbacteria bacterium GW2011_GWA1_47_20 TaxID=1618354 RepID=A0A0G1SJW9_9BACT|nr:MAG: Protein-L-isoaspartate O-methyltransferase [Microgenomates group bacterium GW2011_GWC1_46_20]KKU69711.1 MAG: Protein-L-isoaspartate O-methyltransferase [Candidatus Amesbacteria bacterium GW2011_GWA1_47_20]
MGRQDNKESLVRAAMEAVDRAAFVADEWKWAAGEDRPLPIGFGQTVSQPYTVARMLELLGQGEKVLEVGTGSGWQTAVLARLFKQVYSIEKIPELAKRARIKIYELGIKNVRIKIGDGKKGWDKYALYDGIIVAADAQEIPPKLLEQLADGGRMVIPVRGEMLKIEKHGNFVFVPLV